MKDDLFVKYQVEVNFQTRFAAGIPKNPDLLAAYLDARGAVDVESEVVAGEILAPSTDKWSVGFKGANGRIYYEARCVRAHLKDCANVLQKTTEIKAFKSKLADRVHVSPERLDLTRLGWPIHKPDGEYQMPITVMTMRGPRTSIKVVEYVDTPTTMIFDLTVLNDNIITEDLLRTILTYGGTIKGMGQDRGLNNGRYTFQLNPLPKN